MAHIEIKTVNRKMLLLHGDKLTKVQKAIGRRSNGLHVELRFSPTYGRISFSCTLADGVGGCRFKMIGYSHPYRWSTVRIEVTEEQEARLFAKACEMADSTPSFSEDGRLANPAMFLWFGPNHIKYDKWGASFSFISKFRIWRMHPEHMICNEADANVMLVVWPDLLVIEKEVGNRVDIFPAKDPATLTPDQFEYLTRHYFETERQP